MRWQLKFIINMHGLKGIRKKTNERHEVFSLYLLQVTAEFHFLSYLLGKRQITPMLNKYNREEN